MKTLKVLMTADTVGGVWTYCLQLAEVLQRRHVQVYLATMGAPLTTEQWGDARRISSLQVFESSFKLEWMEDPWDDVAAAGDWLLWLEEQVRPDVVHLNGFAHGALSWRAPRLVVGHSCVLSWWDAVRGEAAPPPWDRYRHEVRRGLGAADLVVAPTEAMLRSLRQHYGPFRRSKVIYNSSDSTLFRPGKKGEFILCVGRLWDEAKNVAALEQVAPELAWPVQVAGAEQHPDGGSVCLNNLQLLGKLSSSALAEKMAAAPIYALPARYEPFGLSVLEAALSGCALVLGDIPTLREVWGDAALFVPPDDTEALRSALNMLIADQGERDRLAAKARLRAVQFHPKCMGDEYMSAYRQLLGSEATSAEGRRTTCAC